MGRRPGRVAPASGSPRGSRVPSRRGARRRLAPPGGRGAAAGAAGADPRLRSRCGPRALGIGRGACVLARVDRSRAPRAHDGAPRAPRRRSAHGPAGSRAVRCRGHSGGQPQPAPRCGGRPLAPLMERHAPSGPPGPALDGADTRRCASRLAVPRDGHPGPRARQPARRAPGSCAAGGVAAPGRPEGDPSTPLRRAALAAGGSPCAFRARRPCCLPTAGGEWTHASLRCLRAAALGCHRSAAGRCAGVDCRTPRRAARRRRRYGPRTAALAGRLGTPACLPRAALAGLGSVPAPAAAPPGGPRVAGARSGTCGAHPADLG